MSLLRRAFTKGITGAAMSMGFEQDPTTQEAPPAMVRSIHGQADSEKPASPALIDIPLNRATRRALGIEGHTMQLPENSIQLSDFQATVEGIQMAARQRARSMGESGF